MSTHAVNTGLVCGFNLWFASQLQAAVNLVIAAVLTASSLLYLVFSCCGISCCGSFFVAGLVLLHIAAAVAFAAINAWMSVVVFSDGKWAASAVAATFSCDAMLYRSLAIYVMALWAALVVLPLVLGFLVSFCCCCLVDDAHEERGAKHGGGGCCAKREAAEQPLIGARVPKSD